MLSDFLEKHTQEIVRQVELRAAAEEGPGPAMGRHARIRALVEQLIEALRHDGGAPKRWAAVGARDAAVQCRERELVRLDVIEQVERHSPTVTLDEMVVVSDWACAAECSRLREDFGRLSALLDEVYEGAIILAPDGRVQYVNRHLTRVLHDASGVPIDQILGKTAAELGVSPELDLSRTTDELAALARRGASSEAFLWDRWVEAKFKAIYGPGGDVAAVALVTRDIQEPKLAQIRLELLSKLSMLVGSVDHDQVAEALAGVPIPQLADWCVVNLVEDGRIGQTFVAHHDPAQAPLREAALRALPGWRSHPLWHELKLKSGFQLLTDVSDELLRKLAFDDEQYRLMAAAGFRSMMVHPVVAHGEVVAILTLVYTTESGRRYGRNDPPLVEELSAYAAHIVENARLLKDLRASEARFRVSLAGSRTMVYEQDTALRYVWYHNPAVPLSLTGKTDEEFHSADEAKLLTDLKRRVLESGESVYQEVPLTFGGKRGLYREAIEPMRDRSGMIVGVIGSSTDITEEKRTQQQLNEALRFRDQMLGILGHDLRNPLGAVTTAAGALLRPGRLAEDDRGKVQVIQRATNRMTEMIETLLDFARVGSLGKLQVSPASTDLGDRAREIVDESRTAWPDRTIDLDIRGDPRGQWDPARIDQAISNLVVNALHHGDPGKPVRVSIDGAGENVVLKVKNEGPPIPTELMPVLFEPFTRGSSDRSPGGLGLGLYIVKQITLAHGGDVDLESNTATGTVVTLRLPRAKPAT
jgi:signal transduction histidine kinase